MILSFGDPSKEFDNEILEISHYNFANYLTLSIIDQTVRFLQSDLDLHCPLEQQKPSYHSERAKYS